MHTTLRYILTKAADLVAMSDVVRRMFGNKPIMFRNLRAMTGALTPVSGDLIPLSGDMAGMSDNIGMMTGDISAMPCELSVMPGDIEALSDNYADMSLGSLLRSLNLLLLLHELVAKLRYELNEWYWSKMGFSDPVLRKIYQEADFDELFTVVPIKVVEAEFDYALYRKLFSIPPPVHPLLAFLIAEKVPERHAKKLLAVLLALARKVLGFTEPKEFWSLPWQFALLGDSGRKPLSPRPPPFAIP